MKFILIFAATLALCHVANAQNIIRGKISDQDNQPLSGAVIFLPEINKGTYSDKAGNYELTGLPNGKIKIQFKYLGYTNKIETILLSGTPVELNVSLQMTVIRTEEFVITGGYSSTQHENAVKIESLKLDPLTDTPTPNFTEMLTRIPGVDMISKGSGVAKPVIRGLSMNDILVLNNGVRFENYQYSDHHPLGIDEFGIEDVEVIKGPASLLYGSDAIGGVINFIKETPAAIGTTVGDYNLQLFSNSLGMTNNLGFKSATKKFFGGIRAGQKTNADYLQGGGAFVPNTRFNEWSAKTNAGFTSKAGTFKIFYDVNQQKLGLAEPDAIEQITKRGRSNNIFYQQFKTSLLSSQNKLYLGNFRIDINTAFQNTELVHFGEENVYEIQMKLATWTYETKVFLPSGENAEYIIGFQGMNQNNTNLNDRETKLLPDAETNNYSGFCLIQHSFDKLKLQAGIRYDARSITTTATGNPGSADYRAPLAKSYDSFSGSLGATYPASEKLLVRGNIAAAYRTPNIAELTSNGAHEMRYEIGDRNLVPENSLEFDASLHYHLSNFTFDIAGFYNRIDDFIFISPAGTTTNSGLSIYQYMQGDATLYGGEAGIHLHPKPVKWLHLKTIFSTVTGKRQNGDYLPFIPAHKLNTEIMVEKGKLGLLKKAFISLESHSAFDQNKAAPDETTTPGYTVLNLTAGGNIRWNNQSVSICLGANNLFDKKYIDHLSTLKEVSYFNPGRNISLTLKVPFGQCH